MLLPIQWINIVVNKLVSIHPIFIIDLNIKADWHCLTLLPKRSQHQTLSSNIICIFNMWKHVQQDKPDVEQSYDWKITHWGGCQCTLWSVQSEITCLLVGSSCWNSKFLCKSMVFGRCWSDYVIIKGFSLGFLKQYSINPISSKRELVGRLGWSSHVDTSFLLELPVSRHKPVMKTKLSVYTFLQSNWKMDRLSCSLTWISYVWKGEKGWKPWCCYGEMVTNPFVVHSGVRTTAPLY